MSAQQRARRAAERAALRARAEEGLTLLELVIAIGVFALMMVAVASTVGSGLGLARNNRDRSIAANLASGDIAQARLAGYTALFNQIVNNQTTSTRTQSVNGVTFTITRYLFLVSPGGSGDACSGSSGNLPSLVRVLSSAAWVTNGIPPARADTLIRPPNGGLYDPAKGSIALQTVDRNGAGVRLVNVTAVAGSSGNPLTTVTDDNGCAFFPQLAPGTYTVTPSQPGYVDPQGDPTPDQQVTVSAGTLTSAGVVAYDQAATIQLTLTAPDGGAFSPAVGGLPVTLRNTAFRPTGLQVTPGSGTARSLGGLFPSTSGYGLWFGDCADAQPPTIPNVAVGPGATTAATFAAPTVAVTVTRGGLPAAGVPVYAVHASDSGCAAGESVQIGTTSAAGTVTAALSFGTWKIALAPDGSGPSQVVTLTTAGSGATPATVAS